MLLGAALRLVHLDAGWFGVDQARDVAWAEAIASGDAYPAVGPLMRGRFHLGAVYYWFWALPAFVASEPLALYAYAALLGVLAVVLAWWLARRVAGPAAALVTVALLATSPVAVIDARIAWAPAALPPWSALVLLLAVALLERPTTIRAAALLAVAALGTQLHVAAAPLALVAGVVVLLRARPLGRRGLAIAAFAGALPLVPMLLALGEPVPRPAAATPLADPTAGRWRDLVFVVSRVVTGLSPAPLPWPVAAWLRIETVLTLLTLAAALWALVRPLRAATDAGLRVVAAAFVATIAAVALLPAEAWYYYLDATLVPGAVLLGAAASRLPWRRALPWLASGVVVARAALLVWWIHGAASAGFVSANLDHLRLGGPRPSAPDARARLLTVKTKSDAARALADVVPLERLARDVHGAGFADLDTDNGSFLRRAAEASDARDDARSALLLYRGDVPEAWLTGFAPPQRIGPLDLYVYEPRLDLAAARLEGCGADAQLPRAQIAEPRAYGAGEPPHPTWPCAAPTVVVPVRAPAPDVAVRVLARSDGAARVVELRARPDGTPLPPTGGAGAGVELAPGAREVEVQLQVDGPARLDLYELHGLR